MSEGEDKSKSLYTLPERIFIEASIKVPTSVTAQAAYIALKCKDYEIEPIESADLLKNDPIARERIIRAANMGHKKMEKVNKLKPELHPKQVAAIFAYDFNLAQDFKILDNDSLRMIYEDLYNKYIKRYDPIYEDEFERIVRKQFNLR